MPKLVLWAMAVVCVSLASDVAQARPKYLGEFKAAYSNVAEAEEAKCGVCHPAQDKKVKNDYADALGKALDGKNIMDVEKIKAALKKIEGEKSATDGKTFGQLLKDGKLPGKK